jgi:phosphoribosylglycinamide formyltransferase 1
VALALGVLISGRGSNLEAILAAIERKMLDAEVQVVLSNKGSAPGLERARARGIPALSVDPAPFAQEANPREAYDARLLEILEAHGVEAVALAGYMRIVTPVLIRRYHSKMVNIHPSLLPAFPGLHAQKQAVAWGAKVSGCTVHFVTEGVDEGPAILQSVVQVRDDDTEESLSARILEQEHRLYPQALQLLAEGRLQVHGRRVTVLPEAGKNI